jgi:hypothetical protein
MWSMKICRLGFMSAILMLAPLGVAKLALPNALFGQIEGSLDFCSQADPNSAEKYQEKKKTLVEGASEQEVADARASKEYKDGYEQATGELSKKNKDEVVKSCSSALEARD